MTHYTKSGMGPYGGHMAPIRVSVGVNGRYIFCLRAPI